MDLLEKIQYFLVWCLHETFEGIANLFDAIPVPDFLINAHNFTLTDDILFYTSLFQVPAGLAIIVSAYVIRFLIRRIPFFG